ncbi:putative ankyrin repeat-containing domain-containing protein [Helianthus debilis subsp. tardiflorus]
MVDFVTKLVNMMNPDDLELQNRKGNTALCLAAAAGNIEIAKILVQRNRKLLDIPGSNGSMPLYIASLYGKHDMVRYLDGISDHMNGGIWTHMNRGWVLLKCVEADFHVRQYRTVVEYLPYYFKATSTWDFPALTTLYLHSVTLCCDERNDPCIDLFSKCANLKDLTIRDCYMNGFEVVSICLPLLSNLTLEQSISGSVKDINIVAPQLKNLTITDFQHKNYLISAPNVVFLLYKGYHCLQPPANDFFSLEKADICVFYPKCAHQVLCLLQRLHSVKFLTLSLEIVERLSSSVELLSNQPSPYANLKSLMIHPGQLIRSRERVKMAAEVRGYLLDSSPGATFTVYSYEYIRVMYGTKLAQDHIKKVTYVPREGESCYRYQNGKDT